MDASCWNGTGAPRLIGVSPDPVGASVVEGGDPHHGANPPRVEILEEKRTLAGGVRTYACTAVNMTPGRAVIRYQSAGPRRIADVDLPAGTVTFAYYWADRPYNVYHW